jgi:hypothetical protein
VADAIPGGGLYLFGGVLRDLALFGRRGFHSDIDLVVDGDWDHCMRYLELFSPSRNRFGGYRLNVANWPIDIWNARDTWAVRVGLVEYRGIGSLTQTTVLNWDAILMNWRSGSFVCAPTYLEQIRDRVLDIVLPDNPNPLGTAVRVFRHLCMKDARKLSVAAARFLGEAAQSYSYSDIRGEELRAYGSVEVLEPIYRLFQHVGADERGVEIGERYGIAVELVRRELGIHQGE